MAGHTPGPWRAEQHQPFGSAVYVDDGKTLATAHGSAAITGEKWPHVANARLIAAAPDMLEALRYVETRCVSEAAYPHASLEDRKMRDVVVAAIAKAEGML